MAWTDFGVTNATGQPAEGDNASVAAYNTYLRDNIRYLKGQAGTIAFEAAATFAGVSVSVSAANGTSNTTVKAENTSNTAIAAHAIVEAAVGGTTSVGDPQFRWTIPSGTSWYAGVDNSASDAFVIGTGTAVGTNGYFQIGTTGNIGLGGTAINTGALIDARPVGVMTGVQQRGIILIPEGSSGATTEVTALYVSPATAAASFTVTNVYGLFLANPSKGAGSTITDSRAIQINPQSAGTTSWGVYSAAGANYFSGRLYLFGGPSAASSMSDASTGSSTTTFYIGNASINVTSDARLKADIRDTDTDWLDVLSRVRVRSYLWNDPSDRNNLLGGKHVRGRWTSPIAQELLQDAPELRYAINAPEINCPDCQAGKVCVAHDSYWHVDPWAFVGPLIGAVQKLTARVAALEAA